MIRVGVLRKKANGLVNLQGDKTGEAPPMQEVLPLAEALAQEWSWDAHFTCYDIPEEEEWPRLNKPVLPLIRETGSDVVSSLLVLDWDNPGHQKWGDMPPGSLDKAYERILEAGEQDGLFADWSHLYTTRSGLRIIYSLDRAVPVDKAEDHHRWLVAQWRGMGFAEIDEGCSDWTRIFRLPRVTRETERTWQSSYFDDVDNAGAELCVTSLGSQRSGKASMASAVGTYLQLDQPDPEEAWERVWAFSDTGKQRTTEWARAAKRRLKGRECFPYLFEDRALPNEERNNTLTRFVGQVCALCVDMELASPENIYALFLEPVQRLEPDEDTPDWTLTTWDLVRRFYAQEAAKHVARDQEIKAHDPKTEEYLEERGDALDRVVRGMREWCPDVPLDGDEARRWVIGRLILDLDDKSFFLMGRDGRYINQSLKKAQIVPTIRAYGLDDLIPIVALTDRGERWRTSTEVLNTHGRAVVSCLGRASGEGVTVEDLDSNRPVVLRNLFHRKKDLEPEYSEDVDRWLHLLFGRHYDRCAAWIANALAFDVGAICALSLEGASGTGKKMLATGLAECINTESLASAADLVSQYQYGLEESPFVVVDEGWPRTKTFAEDPADSFRRFVGGGRMPINKKNEAIFHIEVPHRVLFTANNADVIGMLSYGKTLSPDDRKALGIRLMHIHINDKAAQWLKDKGGHEFTGAPGRRWIRGDSGQKSDYIVAKHFLWLHQEQGATRQTNRLLVEGNMDDQAEFMDDLRLQSGYTPLVIETLLRGLASPIIRKMETIHVDEENGRFFVMTGGVLKIYEDHLKETKRENLTSTQVTKALRNLVKGDWSNEMIHIPGQKKARWKEIDLDILMRYVESVGHACPELLSEMTDNRNRIIKSMDLALGQEE